MPISRHLPAALLLILLSAWAGPASARPFDPRLVFELGYAAEPVASPDGRWVIYEQRYNDIATDRRLRKLWLMALDGTLHRPLSRDTSYDPVWSADGDVFAFVAQGAEPGQKLGWSIRLARPGEASPAFISLRHRPSRPVLSPDGRYLAFLSRVPEPADHLVEPLSPPEGAKWARPPVFIDKVIYRYSGRGYIDNGARQIFVVDLRKSLVEQITAGDYDIEGPLVWSRRGDRLYFSANPHPDADRQPVASDIYSIDRKGDGLRRETTTQGEETSPTLSPDGRILAYLKTDKVIGESFRQHYIMVQPVGGGEAVALTRKLDRDIAQLHWADDGQALYFSYDDEGTRRLGLVSLDGKIARDLIAMSQGGIGRPYTRGDFDIAGNRVFYTLGSPTRPADLAFTDLSTGATRRLTRINDEVLADVELAEPIRLGVVSSAGDGVEIDGWYLLPPDHEPGARHPLIIDIHGGPHAAYGPHFAAEFQAYAAEGYAVYYPNYRGSRSYGHHYANLLKDNYPGTATHLDIMAGVDRLIAEGIADPEQLFLSGGSAGGVQTGYSLGLTDRFRAAAMVNPAVNWLSKVLTGDLYPYQIEHQFPGVPWDNVEAYWKRSPLSLVGNVTTPTLLMTGDRDWRTPISETEQYYAALQYQGVDSVMLRVPGGDHAFVVQHPSWQVEKIRNILAWFDRYRTRLT